jgi:hypothetical protein
LFHFLFLSYFPTNQTYSKEQKEKEKRKYLEERQLGSREALACTWYLRATKTESITKPLPV